MNRRDVIARAEELGYSKFREAKHGTLYRHRYTAQIVSVPHTPGDVRSLKNTLAEVESKAGVASHDETAVSVAAQIIRSSEEPISAGEIVERVASETGATSGGIAAALSALARRDDNAVVRVKRGWYVWDEELAALPKIALESALEYLNGKHPQTAWNDGRTRCDMLAYGRDVARIRPDEREEEADDEETSEEEAVRTSEPAKVASLTGLFELVATEPGVDGVAVIRYEDGTLWVARRLLGGDEL